MEPEVTVAIWYYDYDYDLQVELEFKDMIELAHWLEVPVYVVLNVLDNGLEVEGWTAERIKGYR
jgi:hypothetical protein